MKVHLAVVAVVAGTSLSAQQGVQAPPQIVTSAQGEVRMSPDRASISIGVESRSAAASDAAAQNSRKQRAVIEAVKATGVPVEQIGTSSYNIVPETQYDREGGGAPRTTSYLVSNVVNVELRKVDQVGPVIDAALSAGANQINALSFGVVAADSARRVALTEAVSRARADAEAMARAAGGALGPLIELTATDSYFPPPRPMIAMRAVAAEETAPIEAGQEVIRASVTARWQFVQASPR